MFITIPLAGCGAPSGGAVATGGAGGAGGRSACACTCATACTRCVCCGCTLREAAAKHEQRVAANERLERANLEWKQVTSSRVLCEICVSR